MKKLLFVLAVLVTAAAALGQSWFQTATPTNSLSWSLVNFSGTPTFYTIYFGTNGTLRRYTTQATTVPFTNFIGQAQSALYSVQITATTTNGVETLPSTNAYIYWVTPPTVPGAPVGITVK